MLNWMIDKSVHRKFAEFGSAIGSHYLYLFSVSATIEKKACYIFAKYGRKYLFFLQLALLIFLCK